MKLKQKGAQKVKVQLLDEKGKSTSFMVYETELKELETFLKDSINNAEKISRMIDFIMEIQDSLSDKSKLNVWEQSVKLECETILKEIL